MRQTMLTLLLLMLMPACQKHTQPQSRHDRPEGLQPTPVTSAALPGKSDEKMTVDEPDMSRSEAETPAVSLLSSVPALPISSRNQAGPYVPPPTAGTAVDPESLVRGGIRAFRDAMTSDKEADRIAAFDLAMPDERTLVALFGKEPADLIWPDLQRGLAQMRGRTIKFKEEFDRMGSLLAVELVDVRKSDVSGRYRKVLKVVPGDIPMYRALTRHKTGTSGSSTYMIVDGSFKFVRGLESMYELIQKRRRAP